MVRKRIRRAGAAIGAVFIVGAANPGDAQALWENTYCGFSIPQYSWCTDGSGHTYDSNEAWYSGTVSLQVCERLLYYSSRVEYERECASMSVYEYYWANGGTLFEAQVRHNNSLSRTIWGRGAA